MASFFSEKMVRFSNGIIENLASHYRDNKKTEEMSFNRGFIRVPKNVFDDLTTDLPMRVSYLRYLLEEWFDDTYLGEIQKKMGRNDIYIDEFDVSNSDGDICFQPITKPDLAHLPPSEWLLTTSKLIQLLQTQQTC